MFHMQLWGILVMGSFTFSAMWKGCNARFVAGLAISVLLAVGRIARWIGRELLVVIWASFSDLSDFHVSFCS